MRLWRSAVLIAMVAIHGGMRHRLRLGRRRKARHGRAEEPRQQGEERDQPGASSTKS